MGWMIPSEFILSARAQAEQMGEVVRDSAKRCSSCLNEYDTTKKEGTWDWSKFWSTDEMYYISRHGGVLLAIDRGIDNSVILSALMVNDGETLRVSWNVARSTFTQEEAMSAALQMSQSFKEYQRGDRNA